MRHEGMRSSIGGVAITDADPTARKKNGTDAKNAEAKKVVPPLINQADREGERYYEYAREPHEPKAHKRWVYEQELGDNTAYAVKEIDYSETYQSEECATDKKTAEYVYDTQDPEEFVVYELKVDRVRAPLSDLDTGPEEVSTVLRVVNESNIRIYKYALEYALSGGKKPDKPHKNIPVEIPENIQDEDLAVLQMIRDALEISESEHDFLENEVRLELHRRFAQAQ